ncbi:MAG: hypothetical protein KAX46_05670 [Chromatiaceae bacterium]|nr:hypothetical protein [Chromatiaceae bacterium]
MSDQTQPIRPGSLNAWVPGTKPQNHSALVEPTATLVHVANHSALAEPSG